MRDLSDHSGPGAGAAADRHMRSGARWVFVAQGLPLLVPVVLVGRAAAS